MFCAIYWILAGFEVKSVLLLRRASAAPVRFESIREEISEYYVISVIPIKPNFVVLTRKLIVTEPMADATTLRIRGRSLETVLARSPRRLLTGECANRESQKKSQRVTE